MHQCHPHAARASTIRDLQVGAEDSNAHQALQALLHNFVAPRLPHLIAEKAELQRGWVRDVASKRAAGGTAEHMCANEDDLQSIVLRQLSTGDQNQ